MTSEEGSITGDAARAFAEFVESGGDFEAFVASHPELAGELRSLHALMERVVDGRSGRSLSSRLAERYGSQADPLVSLGGADEAGEVAPASAYSSEVLGRLTERTGAFGRYALRGEIERGGQGAVVRVWDEDLRRALAMKVLLGQSEPEASGGTAAVDGRSLRRFLEEAQVTGQLDHPGIVPVHELGLDAEGRVYFTMKLVKGRTLKDVLELAAEGKEGWSQTRVLGVISKMCEAMSYAHHKGVVHRDLKPANVMVGRFGEVYVMDWGLARVLGCEDTKNVAVAPQATTMELRSERRERTEASPNSPLLTMDGDVVGTPAYMPPEQALGRTEAIGAHSDVYAVGAVLYHLLAGHMPYAEPGMRLSNYDIWYLAQKGPPTPIIERAPETPAELVAICERAMAREIGDRYADMGALAADLSAYLEHRVVSAYETGAWAEAKKWIGRNKALAASLAAAVVLLVGGLAASLAFKARADENARLAERRAEETAEQARIAEANAEEARRQEELAQANAERALEQERLATQRANDVLSLSASNDLEDLVARAETLWPLHPDLLPEYERWLAEARVLLDGLPGDPARGVKKRPSLAEHEAKLAELRARALPLSEDELRADRESHSRLAELEQKRSEHQWRSRMLGLEPWPEEAQVAAALEGESLPSDASGLNALAWPWVDPEAPQYGEEMRALILARRAVAAAGEGERPSMRNTLAWALYRVGRFEEPLVEGRVALEEAAEGAKEQYTEYLAKLEEALGEWAGAEALAERRAERDALLAEVKALEREVNERRTWKFADPEDGWWHVQLSKLVAELKALRDPEQGLMGDTVSEAFGWGVGKRFEFARTIGERSVSGPEAKRLWDEARAGIAASPRYGGLELAPQTGLLPIGADAESGLWEFGHLATGEPAERGEDGKLVLTEETGVVLVLIPAGSFWMGAQKDDPDGRNHDPEAEAKEGPVHEVALSAYLLSKYELTQGQWLRVTGRNPGYYQPPSNLAPSLLHPVEQVSWLDCVEVLPRVGLELPSEAQWECGARGGTSTVWWLGQEREDLRGKINIADKTATDAGAIWSEIQDWPDHDDGGAVHREAGAYPANPFGLHEVHGNVWEWCLDGYDSSFYSMSPARNPVSDPEASTIRAIRGGSFRYPARAARSAYRGKYTLTFATGYLGVRPARAITE